MGLFNTEENKVYMIKVNTCYQLHQEIENFHEVFGNEEDNEAIKDMNYMNKKL